MLSYEARVKVWLTSQGGGNHLAASAQFDHLQKKEVFFYNEISALTVKPLPAFLTEAPEFGDYEGNDDDSVEHDWSPDVSG